MSLVLYAQILILPNGLNSNLVLRVHNFGTRGSKVTPVLSKLKSRFINFLTVIIQQNCYGINYKALNNGDDKKFSFDDEDNENKGFTPLD